MRVLVADPLDAAAIRMLREAGHDVVETTGLQGDTLAAALQGFHGLVVRGATKVTADVLRRTQTLRVVVRAGTGLDNVDAKAAQERGIVVLNTPAANAVSVAELTLGLLLAFERHIPNAAADLRAGRWEKTKWTGRELAGGTLGLVGFGRIGREVALRARAFEMRVVAHDPVLPEWPANFDWVPSRPLADLLAESDVVSLHLPMDGGTRGLIGEAEIARMKRDALLVNCARGGLVDEAALQVALERGAIRGAILDVFETEPAGPNPLLRLPNVLALPHLGASTREAQLRAGTEAARLMNETLAALAG